MRRARLAQRYVAPPRAGRVIDVEQPLVLCSARSLLMAPATVFILAHAGLRALPSSVPLAAARAMLLEARELLSHATSIGAQTAAAARPAVWTGI